jgi:hypothetical protein
VIREKTRRLKMKRLGSNRKRPPQCSRRTTEQIGRD